VRDYIRLSGMLLLICAVAAALLGFTNGITYERIAEQIEIANNAARQEVLSTANEFVALEGAALATIQANPEFSMVKEVYQAKTDGNVVGYTVMVAPKGYSGAIQVIVGVDTKGVVHGVKVGNNTETPGLGKNAEKPAFSDQYKNKSWDHSIDVIKNGTPKDNEGCWRWKNEFI
jgi:electron transport complex protein RnfG